MTVDYTCSYQSPSLSSIGDTYFSIIRGILLIKVLMVQYSYINECSYHLLATVMKAIIILLTISYTLFGILRFTCGHGCMRD